jgi:hypothetical protein
VKGWRRGVEAVLSEDRAERIESESSSRDRRTMTPSPNSNLTRTSNLRPSPLSVRIEGNAFMDGMSVSSDSPLSRTHSTPVPAYSSKLSSMHRARSFGDLAKKTLIVSTVSVPSPHSWHYTGCE